MQIAFLFSPVDDKSTFRIRSQQYGYVHHYGIYEELDLLSFTYNLPPANFSFTTRGYLQETNTSKCVARITDGNQQLVLSNCNGSFVDKWKYSSTLQQLRDVTAPGKGCFSPWNYQWRPPYDLDITTGVSPCSTWNQIILEAGEEVVFQCQLFFGYVDL